MRGEEIQFFGAEDLRRRQGLPSPAYWCFPGTHNKWIPAGTTIEQFSTSMVGEFFDLARRHSLLAQSMEEDLASAADPQAKTEAFSRGLANAQLPGGLLHHVFSVRTLQLTNRHRQSDRRRLPFGHLHWPRCAGAAWACANTGWYCGGAQLAARYTQALDGLGHSCFTIDTQAATVAGAGLIENCLPNVA